MNLVCKYNIAEPTLVMSAGLVSCAAPNCQQSEACGFQNMSLHFGPKMVRNNFFGIEIIQNSG